MLALIGPSGSGKTTVLRCLNGLEIPDGGEVAFNEGPAVAFCPGDHAKAGAGAAHPQRHGVPELQPLPAHDGAGKRDRGPGPGPAAQARRGGCRGQVTAGAGGPGPEKRDQYPHQLSGGQQQRVGIVRALALKPSLLLFDEPTSALDPELVGDVLKVIKELADEGWTMVLVTHELAFAREVADEVVFMDQGVVVERGHPEVVLRDPQNERTKQFVHRLLNPF